MDMAQTPITHATTQAPRIFDRAVLRARRDRAAAADAQGHFLIHEIATRLAERLGEVRRKFPRALILGCHRGELGLALAPITGANRQIGTLFQQDLSPTMARVAHQALSQTYSCRRRGSPAFCRWQFRPRFGLRQFALGQ